MQMQLIDKRLHASLLQKIIGKRTTTALQKLGKKFVSHVVNIVNIVSISDRVKLQDFQHALGDLFAFGHVHVHQVCETKQKFKAGPLGLDLGGIRGGFQCLDDCPKAAFLSSFLTQSFQQGNLECMVQIHKVLTMAGEDGIDGDNDDHHERQQRQWCHGSLRDAHSLAGSVIVVGCDVAGANIAVMFFCQGASASMRDRPESFAKVHQLQDACWRHSGMLQTG